MRTDRFDFSSTMNCKILNYTKNEIEKKEKEIFAIVYFQLLFQRRFWHVHFPLHPISHYNFSFVIK